MGAIHAAIWQDAEFLQALNKSIESRLILIGSLPILIPSCLPKFPDLLTGHSPLPPIEGIRIPTTSV